MDALALEELGRRAEALAALGLDLGDAHRATVPLLEHRFRLFTSLLKATGDNLAALRRAESQHSLGGRFYEPGGALPLNGYGPASEMPLRGMFDSFGHYTQDDTVDSIWPRGRMAEARERRDAKSLELTREKRTDRA